jgi:hypothetical protein
MAQDLSDGEQQILTATQGQTSASVFGATIKTAAWKSKPSWAVIAGNDRALGVTAAAQIAWTRFLIAEATESTPWITELVIDSLVRTRSSQTLPKEYISGDDIAHEILRIVTEENEHQIATIGKGPGDAEVEFVPVRTQVSENNMKRLFGSFKARG